MPTLNIVKIYQQISNNLNNPNYTLSLEHQQTIFTFFYNNFSNLQSLEQSMLDVIITFIINCKKEICLEGKKLLLLHVMNKACTKHNLPPISINYVEFSNKVNGFIPHHKRLNISSCFLMKFFKYFIFCFTI